MNQPALMGILNVTPDSFSGDGVMQDSAFTHAHALYQAGADIIDIGAESTRPGAQPITAIEEWARLEPVLRAISKAPWRTHTRISIDTRHAQTAANAIALGVEIINDVSGLHDPMMGEVLSAASCDVVVMHALTVPADKRITLPDNCNVIAELLAWKTLVTHQAETHGIVAERLIYDPGLGFGKTAAQSLDISLRAAELVASGGRWLFGHSRKSFLQLFGTHDARERDPLTLAFSAMLAQSGVSYLRVHDVTAHTHFFSNYAPRVARVTSG